MEQKTLCEQTRELLKQSPLTINEIAEGADVGYHWLGKFKQGKFPNASSTRIEKLHQFLIRQDSGLKRAG